jgi:hypothetical protein
MNEENVNILVPHALTTNFYLFTFLFNFLEPARCSENN